MRLLLAVITLFTAIHLSTGGKMSSGLHSEKRPADVKDLVGKLLESSSAQHRERRETSPSSSVNKAAEIEQRNDLEHVRRVRQTGGLDFGDLPTTVPAIESVIDISMGSVDGYFMLVRSFIDTVRPGPLPYEIILPTIAQLVSPSMMNDSSSEGQAAGGFDSIINPVVTWLVPVLVLAGLGIVLALLFPLTGCCFCIWRCCGKCGAKNYEHTNKNQLTKCITLYIIFLLGNLFLLVGIILGFLSNDKISMALKSYPGTLRNAVADSVNYVDGTFNEVLFITDGGLNTVLDRVMSDLQSASTAQGNPLQTSLEERLSPFLNTSETLFSNVNSVSNDLKSLNETIREIESLSNLLNDSALQLQEAIANLTSECMGNMACESRVPSFQATDVTVQVDTAQLDDGLATLNRVDINRTRALISSGTSILTNISSIIDQQLSNFSIPGLSQLDSITTLITDLQQTVSQEVGSNGTVTGIIDMIAGYIELGEGYRYNAFVVLFLVLFFLWLVFTLGMVCGVFGYSSNAIAYERSVVSNFGVKLLFLGAGISFVGCGLLLILSTLTFLLSATGQKVCNDLSLPEYTALERIADDPQVWGGSTLVGYLLQSVSLDPSLGSFNANVSVSEILKRCEQNEPLYGALQAESFFDINSLLLIVSNLTSQISLGDNLGSYSSDDFLPTEMRTDFENLAENVFTSFNLTTITQLLNTTSINEFDLEGISNNLTSLAVYFGSIGIPGAVNRTLAIRDNLLGSVINSTLMALQLEMETARDDVSSLDQSVALIGPQVQQTFADLDTFLNGTAAIVNTVVGAYTDQLFGYIGVFVNYTVDLVVNEVGKCGPLSVVYRALHKNLCVNTVNGLNGLWFSIGWCVVFLISIVISTAMVTTYLRKSKTNIHSSVVTGDGSAEVISNRNLSIQSWHEQRGVPTLNTPLYTDDGR